MRIDTIIEALIFAADSPLKPAQMLEVLAKETFEDVELSEELLVNVCDSIRQKYLGEEFPFELRQIDGGYQFLTKREYYSYVRHAAVVSSKKKLSRSSLETLAIIAYRQPVTKPEVEYIRGVNCDHAIQKLLEKKLIEIRGRADAPGKPLVYGTTNFFMEYFSLNNLEDLPKLKEFSIDEDEYKKQFETYLAEQETTATDEAQLGQKENKNDEQSEETRDGETSESADNSGESTPDENIPVNINPENHAGEEEEQDNPGRGEEE